MARGKRGGYQKPSKPAVVSGPGALSARTDGGPSVEYSGLPYGDNKALNDQAAAAPLAQSSGTPGGAAAPRRALPQLGPDGIFSPSDRPAEPLTAGVDWGPGAGAPEPLLPPDDHNTLLRVLLQNYPHPDLERLAARVARG